MGALAAMPWSDWQFWVGTAAALAAAVWLLRGVIARRVLKRQPVARTKVGLTIEGRKNR